MLHIHKQLTGGEQKTDQLRLTLKDPSSKSTTTRRMPLSGEHYGSHIVMKDKTGGTNLAGVVGAIGPEHSSKEHEDGSDDGHLQDQDAPLEVGPPAAH